MLDYMQQNIDSGATPIGSAGHALDEIVRKQKESNPRVDQPENQQ